MLNEDASWAARTIASRACYLACLGGSAVSTIDLAADVLRHKLTKVEIELLLAASDVRFMFAVARMTLAVAGIGGSA